MTSQFQVLQAMAGVNERESLDLIVALRNRLDEETSGTLSTPGPLILPSGSSSVPLPMQLIKIALRCKEHGVNLAYVKIRRMLNLIELALWIDQ